MIEIARPVPARARLAATWLVWGPAPDGQGHAVALGKITDWLGRFAQGERLLAVGHRFELYVDGMELANGYQELTDPDEQLRRFERENRIRELRGDAAAPIDTRLIAALRHGLPECSGVALGVDRMLMSILKLERIGAVLAFDASRA